MTGGFKKLTLENWLEPDDTLQAFGRLSPITGQVHPITADDLASTFLAINLESQVPEDIVAMFEVARGALLYGYFYYPLYALGQDQLWRVCEAALADRFKQLGGPNGRKRFAERIEWMSDTHYFSDEQKVWWTAVKDLRNSVSHPAFQTLIAPLQLPGDLRRIAHAIDCLFDETLDFMAPWHRGELL